ncbi:MAG: hypothetical protein N4A64_07010 [Marinisporobacter sp.]|jgi:hypothetical protein|nr:hypothetical protein [Marinisporobacter sp.]
MYNFILNMWILRKVDEKFVSTQCTRGRITEQERDMILATPQITQ